MELLQKNQKSLQKRKKTNKAIQKTTNKIEIFFSNSFFNLPPQPGLGLKMGLLRSNLSLSIF